MKYAVGCDPNATGWKFDINDVQDFGSDVASTISREIAGIYLRIRDEADFDRESRSAPKVRRFMEYDQGRCQIV